MTLYRMVNGGKLIREATYEQITHFVAADKYVTAHYEGGELLIDDTLKLVKAEHPELVYVSRSTLVKPELIKSIIRKPTTGNGIITLADGQELQSSRRQLSAIRALVESRKELQA